MKSFQLTKDVIKEFVNIWDDMTTSQIAKKFGITNAKVSYIALQIRKAGYPLTKKRINGQMQSLIHEAIKELKFKKKK